MSDNFQAVLSAIRNYYEKFKIPVSIGELNYKMRPMTSKEVRKCVIELKKNGSIDYDTDEMKMIPIYSKEEMQYLGRKSQGPVIMDEVKVKSCMRTFFKDNSELPTSSDIVRKFIELFGVPKNDDPDRYIRELAENGKLERTADFRYCFKGIESSNIELKNYMW